MKHKPIPLNTVVHTPTEAEANDETIGTKDDTKEAKELNLCELLQGYEGETFFSLLIGECVLTEIIPSDTFPIKLSHSYYTSDGKFELSGVTVVFPSRALYEQYPLDPYAAWMKWQQEQKKHWVSVTAWIDDIECESDTAIDTDKIYFRPPLRPRQVHRRNQSSHRKIQQAMKIISEPNGMYSDIYFGLTEK